MMAGMPAIRSALGALVLLLLAVLVAGGASAARALETSIVIDADQGAVLLADKPNRRVPPASLTKLMTAYVVFEALTAGELRLDTEMVASDTARTTSPVRIGLSTGQSVPVKDALQALLVRSANDVAVMIAEHMAGTEAAFAERMTETAARLGMTRTRFATASGLPAPLEEQYTTARDMAVLAMALLRDFPGFYYQYLGLQRTTFLGQAVNGHNAMLTVYEGADGLKTGFTCASGFNLVASAVRGSRRLVGVVLGNPTGPTRTTRMVRLLDAGWEAPMDEGTGFLDTIAPEEDETAPLEVADNTSATPVCGGGGVAGFAVDLGASTSRNSSGALAERASRRFGGQPFTMPQTGGGMLRWKAYVGGLDGRAARQICRIRKASGQWCLVRTPDMVAADFRAAARLWRARAE